MTVSSTTKMSSGRNKPTGPPIPAPPPKFNFFNFVYRTLVEGVDDDALAGEAGGVEPEAAMGNGLPWSDRFILCHNRDSMRPRMSPLYNGKWLLRMNQ